jgi:hypothetical protein
MQLAAASPPLLMSGDEAIVEVALEKALLLFYCFSTFDLGRVNIWPYALHPG